MTFGRGVNNCSGHYVRFDAKAQNGIASSSLLASDPCADHGGTRTEPWRRQRSTSMQRLVTRSSGPLTLACGAFPNFAIVHAILGYRRRT